MIRAVTTLAQNLGMSSVAEGTENAVQVAVMQPLGSRHARRLQLSRPVAAERPLAVETGF